jgi:alkylation response protein AidB-like acyl-CoA dehydrogenase
MTAYATVLTCAEMVGGAQAVLDLTVDYAGQRRQFGQPIGVFQAVQHHCANMAIDVLGSRFATYEAAWRLGTGQPATTEVSTAKAVVSDAYERVCALGHQVHGAIGFTEEHDLHHYLRHATATALTYGDADFHLDQLATQLGL